MTGLLVFFAELANRENNIGSVERCLEHMRGNSSVMQAIMEKVTAEMGSAADFYVVRVCLSALPRLSVAGCSQRRCCCRRTCSRAAVRPTLTATPAAWSRRSQKKSGRSYSRTARRRRRGPGTAGCVQASTRNRLQLQLLIHASRNAGLHAILR